MEMVDEVSLPSSCQVGRSYVRCINQKVMIAKKFCIIILHDQHLDIMVGPAQSDFFPKAFACDVSHGNL